MHRRVRISCIRPGLRRSITLRTNPSTVRNPFLFVRHNSSSSNSPPPPPTNIIISQGRSSSFFHLLSSTSSGNGPQRWKVPVIDTKGINNTPSTEPTSSSSDRSTSLQPSVELLSIESSSSSPSSFVFHLHTVSSRILAYILPAGYPATVSSSYIRYATWSSIAVVFSSAGGVLATQSLLYAVGVGQGSIPLAATMNWVLKDGLGQLGGVIYAAFIGNKFDADPKRWRLNASIILDLATCLEILTPLFPGLFLPVAATANFFKNVSWLSASASRAGLHQSLATSGNLADITAKAGSQSIAASSVGTALGIILSPFIGSTPSAVFPAFMILSMAHLFSLYQGLVHLSLPTLSINRLRLATTNVFAEPLATTDSSLAKTIRTPKEVCELESFVPFREQSFPVSILNDSSVAVTPPAVPVHSTSLNRPSIIIGGSLANINDLSYSLNICETYRRKSTNNHYVLGYCTQTQTIQLLYTTSVDWKSILFGYFHALQYESLIMREYSANQTISSSSTLSLQTHRDFLRQSREWTIKEGDNLLIQLDNQGWWIGTPVIDLSPASRIRIESTAV